MATAGPPVLRGVNQSNVINNNVCFCPCCAQLILAATLALILVQFRRIPRAKLREHCFTFLRLNSTAISLLATIAAFAAFLFATLHLDNVTSAQTVCLPGDVFSSSNAVCICLFGSAANETAATALRPLEESNGRLTAGGSEFQYQ